VVAALLHLPALHHVDAVGERHRLLLIVGDDDRGDPGLALDPLDLAPHARAQLEVEVGQRLVHQQEPRPLDDGARRRHPLLLAAGQLARLAVE
jgi:hypothetical protein